MSGSDSEDSFESTLRSVAGEPIEDHGPHNFDAGNLREEYAEELQRLHFEAQKAQILERRARDAERHRLLQEANQVRALQIQVKTAKLKQTLELLHASTGGAAGSSPAGILPATPLHDAPPRRVTIAAPTPPSAILFSREASTGLPYSEPFLSGTPPRVSSGVATSARGRLSIADAAVKAAQTRAISEKSPDYMKILINKQIIKPSSEIQRARSKYQTGQCTNSLSFRLGDVKENLTSENYQQVEKEILTHLQLVGCDAYVYQQRAKDDTPFLTDEATCQFYEQLMFTVAEDSDLDVSTKFHEYVQLSSELAVKVIKAHVNIEVAPYAGVNKNYTDPQDQMWHFLDAMKQQRQIVENPDVAARLKGKITHLCRNAPVPQKHALSPWLQDIKSNVQQYASMRIHKEPLDIWTLERCILSAISTKTGQHPQHVYNASAAGVLFPNSPAKSATVFDHAHFKEFCDRWIAEDGELWDWSFQKDKGMQQQRHTGGSVKKDSSTDTPKDTQPKTVQCVACGAAHNYKECKEYTTKLLSAAQLAAGEKVRATLLEVFATAPKEKRGKMKGFLKHAEREISEAQAKIKEAKDAGKAGSSAKSGSSSGSSKQPSDTVAGGSFGTRFDALRFVDGMVADNDSDWDSDSDDEYFGVNFSADSPTGTPASTAPVGYVSAFAGKARALAGAVSRAASAVCTGVPKPGKFAVHPDTPTDREYTQRDKNKIKGKIKDQCTKTFAVMHLLQTIQALHFPAVTFKHSSAPALTRSAARQLQAAPEEDDADGAVDSEDGESI